MRRATRRRSVFIYQLGLAEEARLPVVIHNRAARRGHGVDPQAVVRRHGRPALLLVARRCSPRRVEHGWYVSFAGNVTYKNADDLREAARARSGGAAARRDGLSVSGAATGPREDERAGVRRPHRRVARRGARGGRRTSSRAQIDANATRRRSACRERQGEEEARAALPRRREHPRRDRPARGARRRRRRARGRARARRPDDVSRRPGRAGLRGRARHVARAGADGPRLADRGERRAALRRRAPARSRRDRARARRSSSRTCRTTSPRRWSSRASTVCRRSSSGWSWCSARSRTGSSRRRRRRRTARSRCWCSSSPSAPAFTRCRRTFSVRGRTSIRRSSPSAARAAAGLPHVKRVVEASFAHRRKRLANSLELAGIADRSTRRRRSSDRPRPRRPCGGARRRRVPRSSRRQLR